MKKDLLSNVTRRGLLATALMLGPTLATATPPQQTAGADIVMLDNMAPDELRAAVQPIDGRCLTEASGRITLETVRAVAETGRDMISVGWITHSAPALDVALDFEA